MRRLDYTDSARQDLGDNEAYLTEASHSAEVGLRFAERLANQCLRLARLSTTLGRPRDGLSPGLRSFPFGSYIIFFRYGPRQITIINILHSSRDIDAFFAEGP